MASAELYASPIIAAIHLTRGTPAAEGESVSVLRHWVMCNEVGVCP